MQIERYILEPVPEPELDGETEFGAVARDAGDVESGGSGADDRTETRVETDRELAIDAELERRTELRPQEEGARRAGGGGEAGPGWGSESRYGKVAAEGDGEVVVRRIGERDSDRKRDTEPSRT